MDAEVERYLAELVEAARETLGDNLVAAYAAGSIALGAYQPGRSDVDVALVCEDAIDVSRKQALVARLRHEALPCPARGLELVLYRRSVAQAGTPEPGFELELNTGAGMTFRATYAADERPAADGRFWYGLDRSILHQSGYAIVGPTASEMFADLSPADLRALLVDALRWWLAQPTSSDSEPTPGAEDAVLGRVPLAGPDWPGRMALQGRRRPPGARRRHRRGPDRPVPRGPGGRTAAERPRGPRLPADGPRRDPCFGSDH